MLYHELLLILFWSGIFFYEAWSTGKVTAMGASPVCLFFFFFCTFGNARVSQRIWWKVLARIRWEAARSESRSVVPASFTLIVGVASGFTDEQSVLERKKLRNRNVWATVTCWCWFSWFGLVQSYFRGCVHKVLEFSSFQMEMHCFWRKSQLHKCST